jgi:hypothetical protein
VNGPTANRLRCAEASDENKKSLSFKDYWLHHRLLCAIMDQHYQFSLPPLG